MENELKPCPFCSGQAKFSTYFGREVIICTSCECSMIGNPTFTKGEEIIEKHNLAEAWGNRQEPENNPKWISVNETLPEKSGTFIICTSYKDVFVAEFWINRKEFTRRDGSNFLYPIVYWIPLPEAPNA